MTPSVLQSFNNVETWLHLERKLSGIPRRVHRGRRHCPKQASKRHSSRHRPTHLHHSKHQRLMSLSPAAAANDPPLVPLQHLWAGEACRAYVHCAVAHNSAWAMHAAVKHGKVSKAAVQNMFCAASRLLPHWFFPSTTYQDAIPSCFQVTCASMTPSTKQGCGHDFHCKSLPTNGCIQASGMLGCSIYACKAAFGAAQAHQDPGSTRTKTPGVAASPITLRATLAQPTQPTQPTHWVG